MWGTAFFFSAVSLHSLHSLPDSQSRAVFQKMLIHFDSGLEIWKCPGRRRLLSGLALRLHQKQHEQDTWIFFSPLQRLGELGQALKIFIFSNKMHEMKLSKVGFSSLFSVVLFFTGSSKWRETGVDYRLPAFHSHFLSIFTCFWCQWLLPKAIDHSLLGTSSTRYTESCIFKLHTENKRPSPTRMTMNIWEREHLDSRSF